MCTEDINTIQAFIGTCSTVDIITPQNARKGLSLLPLTGLCLNSEVLSKHICTKLVGMQYRELSWSLMLTPLTSISPVYDPFCVYVCTCVGGGGGLKCTANTRLALRHYACRWRFWLLEGLAIIFFI